MEEFSEEKLQLLIDEALKSKNSEHPFAGNNIFLGLGETNLLEYLHERLSKRIIGTYVNDIFQDARVDILSRKIPLKITDIHTITKNCRKCNIDNDAELPKWNVINPDVVIVVESPSLSSDAVSVMVSAFKKAGFSSEQMCLTYVNRCPVKRKYENNEIINCSSYLHSEIQILNPKIILCLGALPSSVIFGTEIKIKETRGRITWLGYWPIITTYSPHYILKQQEVSTTSSVVEQFENDIAQAFSFVTKTSGENNDY